MCRLVVVGFIALVGCRAAPQAPEKIYDVGPFVLARDRQTAESFSGYRVRVALAAGEYETAPGELRVPASVPGVSPLLVFRCAPEAVPARTPGKSLPAVVVVGRCRGPQRDGVFRTHRADFWVLVEECAVIVR